MLGATACEAERAERATVWGDADRGGRAGARVTSSSDLLTETAPYRDREQRFF